MKKFLSIVLSICLIMVVIPIGTFSFTASAETDGYYTYTVFEGKAYIEEVDTSISGDITIPSTLGGYPVTIISTRAFYSCTSLESITIPDGVTIIGNNAFGDCDSLTSITIGDGVTSIGDNAFYYCTSLKSITIPDSVTYIGDSAFNCCESLTSITIGDGVTSIGDWAFSDCTSLVNITIPDSVTSIGKYAFFYCTSLTSITIGSGVTGIGYAAFNGCSSCTRITVDKNNTIYHSSGNCIIKTDSKALIAGCKNSVIPDDGSVTSIGNYAFDNCRRLTSITIPDSVTSIGMQAFYNCKSLTSITIPDSVTSIGDWAFNDCAALSDVYYDGSENDRENITVGSDNNFLTDATWHYNYCKVGGVHTYGEWIIDIEPTCTSNGLQIKKCEHCGKTIEQIINGSHSYGNWIVAGEPTCTSDGAEHRVCLICGVEEERIITALGHNYDVYFSSVAATCKNNGYYSAKCRNCGIVDIITTSGHIYKNGKCVSCDISAEVVESEHDYAKNTNQTWTVTKENASCLKVYFSAETQTESRYDFIYIYDGADNLIGKYSGSDLAGRTIKISGDTVKIKLTSDGSVQRYGFYATVTPESIAGDTNGDGAVNALDMLNIQDAILTGAKTDAYDINGDGLVNLLDLVRIKKILAGKA